MNPSMKLFVFSVLLIFFGLTEIRAQKAAQTSFGMEMKIKKSQRIPRYIVKQIIKNEESFAAGDIDDLSKRLKGSLVNLNNDRKPDLFVQGDDGANITGFWLFRNAGAKWELILYSRAAWLDIKNVKSKGFRNVEIHAASAVRMWGSRYEFDGAKYIPKRCWEEIETGKKIKREYFQCSGSLMKPYV